MEYFVTLVRDGNQIIAMMGRNLQDGIGGCGNTAPDALRDLAARIEKEGYREIPTVHPKLSIVSK